MTQRSERTVWLPPFEQPTELGGGPDANLCGLSDAELDAAGRLAELHAEIAAALPTHSRTRALMLRSGAHWARLAGLPRRSLRRL